MTELSRYPHLDKIDTPVDLRRVSDDQLPAVADELRQYLIEAVASSGGHFGAGLGVVELTVALHYVFDTPVDRLVWDVGHQCYPHKILTGRRNRITTIKKKDGLAPFPRREESEYDTFGVGHSSTSISAALGMAIAAQRKGDHRKVVAVIGDGAMTAGMAFEALNHGGDVSCPGWQACAGAGKRSFPALSHRRIPAALQHGHFPRHGRAARAGGRGFSKKIRGPV